MKIKRILNLPVLLDKKSHFLFGPRQTGKSWLIREQFPQAPVFDLLDDDIFLQLSRSAKRLGENILPSSKIAIIDEIQKLPNLLNEVHRLIETRGLHFLLTGSSARKLRQAGVNLLGGRARIKHIHPLTSFELQEKFDLLTAINNGLLPAIYFSDDPDADLKAYVGTYLKEEIAAEGLTRNLPAFSRFLEVAALCNRQIINFTKISNDAQVARTTVQDYFQILEDTLLATLVPAWTKSKKRKAITTAKFYLFDTGVTRVLQNRNFVKSRSPEFGDFFESFIFHEIKTYLDYRSGGAPAYWRSTSGFEVDFVLPNGVAVEVKASSAVGPYDLKGLTALAEEKQFKRHILVSLESRPRKINHIEIFSWQDFLQRLWAGEIAGA